MIIEHKISVSLPSAWCHYHCTPIWSRG